MANIFDARQKIPKEVLDAAFALHQTRSTGLIFGEFSNQTDHIESECNPLWRCGNGQVEFTNLKARNHCVAIKIFHELMPLNNLDALFDAADELWKDEIGHTDFASGRLLGLASESVNVLAEATQAIKDRQHHKLNLFELLHLVEVSLPHISHIDASDVVALIDAQHPFTKHDMARGMIFNAIESRLRSEPQLAWKIWDITREKISESMQSLYSTALLALLYTDKHSLVLEKLKEDVEHIDPLIVCPALWVLSRAIQVVHQLNERDLNNCVVILINKTTTALAEIQQTAIRAVANAALKDERLMSTFVQLALEGKDDTLSVVANFLFINQQELLVSASFKPLLQALLKLTPVQTRAIHDFDMVLYQLYARPEHQALVEDCLSQWIIRHGSSKPNDKSLSELFAQTINQIANDYSRLQALITHWLLAPERQLAVACSDLIDHLENPDMKPLEFPSEVLDTFEPQDFKFLARRLLGYIRSEEPLLSMTFSLLKTQNASKRSFQWVFLLFTEDIGRDYRAATMKAVKARQETAQSPEKELFARIYTALHQRSEAINRLPRLEELKPPARLSRAIALNRAREIEHAQMVANEKSVFRELFSTVSLKAGVASFSVFNQKIGPTQHLQTFSHSITLPIRSVTDPVGYAIDGLHYRLAKREDE